MNMESNIYSQYQTIEEEASVWVARIDRGLNVEEEQYFVSWLMRSKEHKAIFYDMARYWDESEVLRKIASIDLSQSKKNTIKKVKNNWVLPLAASVIFVMLGIIVSHFDGRLNALINTDVDHYYTEVSTNVGKRTSVSLPDGSRLMINTDSEVTVDFDHAFRKIILQKGELHIDVAHDEDRPLFVVSKDHWVRAVGTAFNVRLNDYASFEVIVTEGRVAVGDDVVRSMDQLNDTYQLIQTLALKKGEAMLLNENGYKKIVLSNSDMDRAISWVNGKLVFTGETMQEVLKEIERYTPVRFEMAEAALNDIRVVGLYQTGDVEGFLASIKENLGIRNVVVTSNRIRLEKEL